MVTIEELIRQGEEIKATAYDKYPVIGSDHYRQTQYSSSPVQCIRDTDTLREWERLALRFLRQNHPDDAETKDFEKQVQQPDSSSLILFNKKLAILNAVCKIDSVPIFNCDAILSNVFNRFQKVEQALARRPHAAQESLKITNEYDVQYLLNALLKLYFNDIRSEEPTPSNVGNGKRIDFLLPKEQIGIEVKMTRDGLKDSEIGDQLKIDIASYKSHPDCKTLYCFVYDKDRRISNPAALQKDLEDQSMPEMAVRVFIRPE